MTNQEALQKLNRWYENNLEEIMPELLDVVYSALQEQAEREKGCEWCNKGLRFECDLIDDGGNTASIKDNEVQTCIAKFCPNCGRDLRKPVSK